jgi:MFS family permease
LGCAGIFSGALIIIAHTVPLRQRPTYTGFIGAIWGIASVAGPLMGGAFTERLSWRWCFYINLPIGAVTVLSIILFFKSPKVQKSAAIGFFERAKQFDIFGCFIFVPAIICLLLALQWGGSKYPWSNGRIIGLLVTFGVLIIIFIGIQKLMQDNATVPPRIIKNRSIWAGILFSTMLGASFFLFIFYVSIPNLPNVAKKKKKKKILSKP